jgi:enoyl-CoA hydratase/carnithine racemase
MEFEERRNALRPEDADDIIAAIKAQDSAGAVVLCGGPLAFCAGADLRKIQELAAGGEAAVRKYIYRSFQGLARTIREFPGVVISAVDGPALGLGADIALVCDVCYVGTGGWIEQGWAKIGAIPGIGGAWITVKRAGYSAAWQFVMEQRRWSGRELEAIGLAINVEGSAEEHALERAEWITSHTGGVANAYKSLLVHSPEESFEVHLERCGAYQARLVTDPERQARRLDPLSHTNKGE